MTSTDLDLARLLFGARRLLEGGGEDLLELPEGEAARLAFALFPLLECADTNIPLFGRLALGEAKLCACGFKLSGNVLDLVAARWGAVERLLKKGEREIYAKWRAQAGLMRKWFKAKRTSLLVELQKVLEPFCEPGSKKAQRLADDLSGQLFVFRQLFKKIPTHSPDEIVPCPDTATVLLGAKAFLHQAKAAMKEYGITN